MGIRTIYPYNIQYHMRSATYWTENHT